MMSVVEPYQPVLDDNGRLYRGKARDVVDYTIVRDEPPPISGMGAIELEDNLRACATMPKVWHRIMTYKAGKGASMAASDLRQGRRGKNRPAGEWMFRSGKLPEPLVGNGVWAIYLGPSEGD